MVTNRTNISNKFENGDIPSQSDFGEIFDSFVHKDEDKATIQMVETGTDNESYVTPALLRAGLQNVGTITGNCYFPLKENFDNFSGSTIYLKESPINFSVQAFKNGQLLLEEKDYTVNYETAVLSFSTPITDRNIEIDYWYKNLESSNDSTGSTGSRPYKVYTALLTQSGTSAPVATVLENTLGGEIVWSYDAAGTYSGTLAGAFTYLKTATYITPTNVGALVLHYVTRTSLDTITVSTKISTVFTGRDNLLSNTTIEIRVYNSDIIKPNEPRGKFMSTWKTDNLSSGSSSANQVRLPLISTGTYDMVVDWGDGKTSVITTYNSPDSTHIYDVVGTYNISISGVCSGWRFNYSGDRLKILTVSQWGILKLGTNQGNYFYGCPNLDLSVVSDTLDLTDTTSLEKAFEACSKITTINNCNDWIMDSISNMSNMFAYTNLFNHDISSWNTINVNNMQGMFRSALAFNQPIGKWDTRNVTNISSMLYSAQNFNQLIENWDISKVTDISYVLGETRVFNQPIGNWNTGKVTKMTGVFYNATAFNQPIENWDTSKVTDMSKMFQLTSAFNQPIDKWKTNLVGNMSYMFSQAKAFNQPIGNWNTGSVTDMNHMFELTNVFNQNIGSWDTSKVLNMSSMFSQSKAFDKEIGNWNTSSVTTMALMFYSSIFNQNVETWDTSNVIIMSSMFQYTKYFNQDISSWNTGKVTAMNSMFSSAKLFNQPIGSWNTSNVTSMLEMFYGASVFNQPMGDWNTSNVINMESMFRSTPAFNQPIGKWITGKVLNMSYMFMGASKFNQPLENWDTSKVTTMTYMFADTSDFDHSIGKWNISNVKDMSFMFRYSKFNQPIGNWKTDSVENLSYMFYYASAFNQPIGDWNTIKVSNMRGLFQNATNFNQPIGNWNTVSLVAVLNMFNGATNFDQNIGSWNVSKVNDFAGFMATKTLTTFSSVNLDAIYNGWSSRTVLPLKSLTFGTAKYTSASAANRAILTGTPNSWSISDGGLIN